MTVTLGQSYETILAQLTNPKSLATKTLYKAVGKELKKLIQKRFETSSNESVPWLSQYPNTKEPWINLAGALSDWNKGIDAQPKRFSPQPPLVDTGDLKKSISYRVTGDSVEVTSNSEYADLHTTGGMSVQPVSKVARAKLKSFLREHEYTRVRAVARFLLGGGRLSEILLGSPLARGDPKTGGGPWREKLGFLLKKDAVLETSIVPRPFMEVTDELERELALRVEQIIKLGPH